MKSVTIVPQYGYGWQRNDRPIDVPPPFKMEVRRYEESNTNGVYNLIAGRVLELGHVLEGLWILVALRTAGQAPTYNILCYEVEPPFIDGGDVDPFPTSVTGFGTLKTT